MLAAAASSKSLWEVFLLFLIPWGGGIPAGVLLGKARAVAWPILTLLYFLSDVVLACMFEPVIRLLIYGARRTPKLAALREAFKKTVQKATAHYGSKCGPLAFIMISLGADPMTCRTAAIAAGYGFVSGWLFAIAGDMIYFFILMISTLWLQSILGDGTMTMVIIVVVMIVAPIIIRRFRKQTAVSPMR